MRQLFYHLRIFYSIDIQPDIKMDKRAIAKIAVFVAVVLIVLEVTSALFGDEFWFTNKYLYDRNARSAAFSLEPEGQIDVINIGNSLSYTALSPLELFRDQGFTSYDLGQEGQTPVETYFTLRKACKTQTVKVVLLEVDSIIYVEDGYNLYTDFLAEMLRVKYPILRYHYMWQRLSKKRSIREYYKGFLVNEGLKPYTGGEYYDFENTNCCDLYDDHIKMFRLLYNYCKRNDIHLILYSAPSPVCYDIEDHNAICKLANEYGLEYLDANCDLDKIQIDWATDTHDEGDHLNLSGTRKMTKYLGHYLSQNCGLTDHRNDPEYKQWTDFLVPYRETIKKMKGTYYSELEAKLGFDN